MIKFVRLISLSSLCLILFSSFLAAQTDADIHSLIDISINHVDRDNTEALRLIGEAEEASVVARDSAMMVRCRRIRGQILYRLERTEEAMRLFETTLPIARHLNLKREEIMIANTYGLIFLFTGKYDRALEKLFLSNEIASAGSDTTFLQMTFNNIAIVYYKLMDYPKALYYWKQSLRWRRTDNPIIGFNISLCYSNMGKFKKAKAILDSTARSCGQSCSASTLVHLKYASGYRWLQLGQYRRAEKDFQASLRYARESKNSRLLLDNSYLLADIYDKWGDRRQALAVLKQAERIIRQGSVYNLEKIKVFGKLADLYRAGRHFEEASLYQSKYILLKDSIYDERLTTGLMKAEAAFQEKSNVARIAAQEELLQVKEESIQRQKQLNALIGVLGLTVFLAAVFLFRSYRLKKRISVLLERKVRQRTLELERYRASLLSIIDQKDQVMRKNSQAASETIRSVEGLCLAAIREINEPVAEAYFLRVRQTVRRLRR